MRWIIFEILIPSLSSITFKREIGSVTVITFTAYELTHLHW